MKRGEEPNELGGISPSESGAPEGEPSTSTTPGASSSSLGGGSSSSTKLASQRSMALAPSPDWRRSSG